MPRKKRKGEYTCDCGSYKFPHRFGGGKCTGDSIAKDAFTNRKRICTDCVENMGDYCAVVDGREDPENCPAFQEFVEFHEIKWRAP